jgi:hypothetical protein
LVEEALLTSKKQLLFRFWAKIFLALQDTYFTGRTASFFATGMHPVYAIFMNYFDNFTIGGFRNQDPIP